MVNYNDFALPNLENFNLMQKQYEKSFTLEKLKREDAQIVFNAINTMFYVTLFLFKTNRTLAFQRAYNIISAIKLKVGGELLEFNFKEQSVNIKNSDYLKVFFSEYVKIVKVFRANVKSKFVNDCLTEVDEFISIVCD